MDKSLASYEADPFVEDKVGTYAEKKKATTDAHR
jgi:hypothetical protein